MQQSNANERLRRGKSQVARDVGIITAGASRLELLKLGMDECGLSQAGNATALDRGAKTELPALAVGPTM